MHQRSLLPTEAPRHLLPPNAVRRQPWWKSRSSRKDLRSNVWSQGGLAALAVYTGSWLTTVPLEVLFFIGALLFAFYHEIRARQVLFQIGDGSSPHHVFASAGQRQDSEPSRETGDRPRPPAAVARQARPSRD
ncbi:hypothetical protein [Natronospira bacteriovora]|uniref:DUF2061 domain-containing protein n=1 Tax=Natronospira bacteriovora TaxID=3069753 RepID=A0ABU0W9U7_9GAMM|nr:hypothetical protein [Natronospira sp. AB-CW4]MDQ2070811.1 hypothetical protein [Natronospira sp. AB-CW4]